jgi:hypothetical protein
MEGENFQLQNRAGSLLISVQETGDRDISGAESDVSRSILALIIEHVRP